MTDKSNCPHDEWHKDSFGPWICKNCGAWSVTKEQAAHLTKTTLGLKLIIRTEESKS